LATEFTEYLVKRGVLDVVILKAKRGGDTVVRVNPEYRSLISELAEGGSIANEIKPFFDKFIKEERSRLVGAAGS
jgi:hypothetical protein